MYKTVVKVLLLFIPFYSYKNEKELYMHLYRPIRVM